MQTTRWLAIRLFNAVATMFGVSVLIFLAVRQMPGSYADLILGPLSSAAAEKARFTEQYGLDESLVAQYVSWIGEVVHGNLGVSLVSLQPIGEEFALRLPVTISLTAMAMLLTILIGLPLGVYSATRGAGRGAGFGRLASGFGISMPDFVLGSLVVFLFSRYSLGLTIGNFTALSNGVGAAVRSLILPAAVLAVFCIAATARTTRDAVLNVLVEPHIAAAVARGESKLFIIRHHVLRNAAIPVLTLTATITAYLLGGAVVVEAVFDIPGMGSYLIAALDRRDYAVIQGGVLLATAVFVTMSLLVDLLSGLIDPRVSATKGAR